ncbi:AAA family ATPase [Saccharopolyspora erythraea]|uniref:helix-turn-helix transcriptional regulator n=1 Tax=Saccharopolyspora erythraea TaxID=1836 RepID=UPI001BA8D48C|nr:LuxR family transcriptional regulator [Saccharopolyspora erythraea]QUH01859.1 AAA family ATPase [Saccharopolyspora erythraea]
MTLVDRDREIAALEELLIDCQHSRARVAVISGDAGSGKTALLHAFAQGATEAGAVWLSATASQAEQSMPLAVLDQIIRRPELSPELTDRAIQVLDRVSLDFALESPACHEISASLTPVLRELWKLLHELTSQRPVVISVDDVHHADDYSLKFLLYLLSRLRSAPLLVILTERIQPPQFESVLPADLPEQPYTHAIRLKPLSRNGVEKLLCETFGPKAARALAGPIEQMGTGCPTLIQALIEDTQAHVATSHHTPVAGEAFGQAVVRCAERSGPLIKKLARTIAILDESVSSALLGKMLDLDNAFAAQALSAFTAKGVVGNEGFRQTAVRDAILDSIAPQERMAMHRKAAELLYNAGAQPSVVARHIIAAGSVCDRWMITTLQDAAEDALNADNTDLAIRCLQLAQQICAGMTCDISDRATLTSLLARAEWRRDPSAALRHLPLLESAARDGKLEGRHAMMLLVQLLWHGRSDAALDILNCIMQTYYGTMTFENGAPSTADTSLLWLFCLYPDFLKQITAENDCTADSPFDPIAVTSQLQEAAALAKALASHSDKDTLDIAERILQSAHLSDRALAPLTAALVALICIDRLDIATKWCDALLVDSEERNASTWHAVFAALRSIMSVREGDLYATRQHAGKALELLSPKSWGIAIGIPLASMLSAFVSTGDHAQAEAVLKTPVPEQMFLTPVGLFYLHARGQYHLAAERTHAALSDFQMCAKLMTRWNMDLPALLPWRTDAALAHLQLGDEASARRLAEEQLRLVPAGHHRPRGLALRILAAVSSLRARPRLLQDAQTALQLCDDKLGTARVLADASQAHHELHNGSLARKLARRAHELAEQCGAEPLARLIFPNRLTSDHASEGSSMARSSELSDAELRVAALAAGGHTNVEIAKKLYVTVSTVEQHLTRIYRKLAVDRSELSSVIPLDPTVVSIDASAAS